MLKIARQWSIISEPVMNVTSSAIHSSLVFGSSNGSGRNAVPGQAFPQSLTRMLQPIDPNAELVGCRVGTPSLCAEETESDSAV